jgi:hypothetical protein
MFIAALIAVASTQSMLNAACLKLYRRTEYKHLGTVALLGFTLSHSRRGLNFSPRFLAVDAVVTDTLKVVERCS